MQPDEIRKKKVKTPEQALAALMRLCARAEKSQEDARRLMRGWGLAERDAEGVLAKLVRDRFIDDARYAGAFVREKLRLSGWGEYKIRTALQRKRIDRALIDAALAEADRSGMDERLRRQLERKARTAKYSTQYELKTKLIRYGLSLGYDYETVVEAASGLVTDTETCDEFCITAHIDCRLRPGPGDNTPTPEEYIYPICDVEGLYSANFGEMRPGHFHAGIDIKTDGAEGKPLVAVADGYVSRVSLGAVRLRARRSTSRCSNGTTAVYGHLQRFRKRHRGAACAKSAARPPLEQRKPLVRPRHLARRSRAT